MTTASVRKKNTASTALAATPEPASPATLLSELRELILSSRQSVAQVVNSALTMLYWEIGRRIQQDVLKSKRAGYGEQIVAALGRQLGQEFGRGFGERNLHRMIQFAVVFPDEKIVSALRTQLGWTHFKAIIPLDDPLKRDFYAEMCRIDIQAIKFDSIIENHFIPVPEPVKLIRGLPVRVDNRSVPPFAKGGLGGILAPPLVRNPPRPPFFKGGR